MNKNVDPIEFQLATLEASRAADHAVRLIWAYGSERSRIDPNDLELITDADGQQWWQEIRKVLCQGSDPDHQTIVSKHLYKMEGCRITSQYDYGRRLVHVESQQLFMEAIRRAGIIGNNSINLSPEGLCTWEGLEFALDYSPAQYAGDFRFNDGELSEFLQAGKPALLYAGSGEHYKGHHQQQKIGKSVRYILDCLGLQYNDALIETTVNIIKAANTPLEIKLASETSDDISEIYDWPAADGSGSLLNSCMRGHGDFYFDLDSCRNVDLAFAQNAHGELIGRALIWNTTEGITVMDRIYGDDKTITAFKKYASERGIWFKYAQAYDQKRDWIDPNGNEVTRSFEIEIDLDTSVMDERCPYMDTFCFYGLEEHLLTNSTGICGDYGSDVYELRNTDGTADRR